MPQLDGIDCSSNQSAALDQGYDEAIQAGAWFAFEKATGSTSSLPWATYTNPFFAHRRQLIAQKFRYGGAYMWVQTTAPAPLQVAHFIKVVGELGLEAIQVDSEQAGVTDQMTVDVTNLLYAHYGPRVLVYANLARLNAIKDHIPDDVYFWLPWYDDPWPKVQKAIEKVGLADRIIVWQWGGGRQGVFLPSLGARVDSNYVLDPVKFRRACGEPHRAPGGIPEEDDLPFSEEQLRQMMREEIVAVLNSLDVDGAYAGLLQRKSFDATYGLWREPEIQAILRDQSKAGYKAATEASGPATESP